MPKAKRTVTPITPVMTAPTAKSNPEEREAAKLHSEEREANNNSNERASTPVTKKFQMPTSKEKSLKWTTLIKKETPTMKKKHQCCK
ncbi:hypothetical protein F8M41_015905 [Gigaspora margarita]|uniref:Uncharacterized protein n=1 Tax=Gigaspora margarita TaxID=4874 RepID=A0A8H3WW56_GIGMA|nr:hypothetical protein F8M41_015905 [Gigaspora margarita]